MSLTSKIIEQIREHVANYEANTSMADSKQNEVNNLKSLKKSKSIEYQLRDAQEYLIQFETRATTYRSTAQGLVEKFIDDFDSTERSEVEGLIIKLK